MPAEALRQNTRTAALVAGIGLLIMAVVAGFANFAAVEALVVPGDPETTAQHIRDHETLFRLGIAGFVVTAILDIVVAWALLVFFRPVNPGVATIAAWLRAVYAGPLIAAAGQLTEALHLVTASEALAALTPAQRHAEALLKITTFQQTWQAALALFAVHLLLLGYLTWKAAYAPTFLGVLLALAGLGYLTDSLGSLLIPGYAFEAALFTFVGEVILLIWLLVRGRKVILPEAHPGDPIPSPAHRR